MEAELYEAAMHGNVRSLLELLGRDELLLDRIMTGNHIETPLHIAAMLGHLDFVKEVLARKPELAREQDSQRLTPLHLAAAKGHLKIVASLLEANPEMCFACDKYKRNPLHVAAMKGHIDVLELLVQARPDAAHEVTEHDQTILHLCVKHNKPEALKLLIDILGDNQFINKQDEDGNTILHLAASDRQTTIDFLIDKGVSPRIKNSRGSTALGLLAQGESVGIDVEMKDYVPQTSGNQDPSKQTLCVNDTVNAFHPPIATGKEDEKEGKTKWLISMQKALFVVATLIATLAYQASITPPGGLWQEDHLDINNNGTTQAPDASELRDYNVTNSYLAGESILAYKFPIDYKHFVVCNTISFIAALSVIMILISGLPLKRHRITTWIAMLAMWVAITFTGATYAISMGVQTPAKELNTYINAIGFAVLAWVGLMALIFLCHVVRLIVKLIRKVLKFVRKALTRHKSEEEQKKRPDSEP